MIEKDFIFDVLNESKRQYINDGINIIGFFGSFARDEARLTSDLDVAYTLSKELFFEKYKGFASVSKLSDVQDELSKKCKRKVDFISLENTNQNLINAIKKEIVYV